MLPTAPASLHVLRTLQASGDMITQAEEDDAAVELRVKRRLLAWSLRYGEVARDHMSEY